MVNNDVAGLIVAADVNGPKKGPNRAGYDIFFFKVTDNDHVVVVGSPNVYDEDRYCRFESDQSNWNGIGCTADALMGDEYRDNLDL